jgi:hypothetical protein
MGIGQASQPKAGVKVERRLKIGAMGLTLHQGALQRVEMAQLQLRFQIGVVRDVVGEANELVVRHHVRTQPFRKQPGRYREVLASGVLPCGWLGVACVGRCDVELGHWFPRKARSGLKVWPISHARPICHGARGPL